MSVMTSDDTTHGESSSATTATTTNTTDNNTKDKKKDGKQYTRLHVCHVKEVPLQRWSHILVSCSGRALDIYLNGKLVQTCMLPGVPNIQSNDNFYITPSGGFSGYTSRFRYWPNAISPQDVWDVYRDGFSSGFMNFFEQVRLKMTLMSNGMERGSVTL